MMPHAGLETETQPFTEPHRVQTNGAGSSGASGVVILVEGRFFATAACCSIRFGAAWG